MKLPEPALPKFLEGQRRIAPEETFTFACHPGVSCFNVCCSDVNIVMTPLDVLGLARRLDMHTREFLEQHTVNPVTKDLHIPVIALRMGPDPERLCPFVAEKGCTVYEDRPWACRMYPLGVAIPPARAGEEPQPVSFLFDEDHCMGNSEAQEWTPRTWRRDQQIMERDALETGYRDLVSHPWFIGGRQLDPKRMEMFYMACYDVDTFRSFVFESSFRDRFELVPELIDQLGGADQDESDPNDSTRRKQDEALMLFAFRWLRFAMFGEPTITVKANKKNQVAKPAKAKARTAKAAKARTAKAAGTDTATSQESKSTAGSSQ